MLAKSNIECNKNYDRCDSIIQILSKMFIGSHVSYGISSSAETISDQLDCNMIQIFTHSPQRYAAIKKDGEDKNLKKLGAYCIENNKKCVIHASYLINFCRNKKGDPLGAQSFREYFLELQNVDMIGKSCLGAVVHMGKNIAALKISNLQALRMYRKNIMSIIRRTSDSNSTIILETGAGSGTEIMSTVEDLSRMYSKMPKSYQKRIMFCIDTCHIWAAGYDISNAKAVERYFALWDQCIGIEKIALIHFNNSMDALGSKKDRHADIQVGKINKKGMIAFVKMAAMYNIPIVTETPNNSISSFEQIAMIKSWADIS